MSSSWVTCVGSLTSHPASLSRKPLSVEMIRTEIAGRDYQIGAIRTVLEQLEAGRSKFLLAMATGTGKTRVAVALVELLMRARWAKRILFLVDRIALAGSGAGRLQALHAIGASVAGDR